MSDLALLGGTPVRTTPFPAWPVHHQDERRRLLDVLESGNWWATQGSQVRDFEAAWGTFHETGPAVAVTNGTHALEVALLALGIGEGDEVIVPDWSFVASASAVLMVNAVPVLVDVDPRTGCLDVERAEVAITGRTAAIMAVHIAGHPPDMDRLKGLCRDRGLALVEDCAHAHGSTWNHQPVGTLGDAGTFSFQASKLMTAGEGGAIVSRRAEVLAAARSYSDCGRAPGEWFYGHVVLGGNYRMTEWQAAVLSAQLERLPEQHATREANARWLDDELARIPGVAPQYRDPRCTRQGHYCYLLRIDPSSVGASREAVRLALEAEGMPLTMAYPPIHRLECFSRPDGFAPRLRDRTSMPDYAALELPVTEALAAETLWFTTAVLMGGPRDCQDVVDAVQKVCRHAGELRQG